MTEKKVLLVNNYIREPFKIRRLSKEISRIIDSNPSIVNINQVAQLEPSNFDFIVLSGGDSPLNREDTRKDYKSISSWIRKIRIPVLGICFGHQLIGFSYGSRIARLNKNFEGYYDLRILNDVNIFRGLPKTVKMYKSNSRIVVKLMKGFIIIASSEEYKIEAFKHVSLPIFGVQFHPENYNDEYFQGKKVLENFFSI